MGSVCAAFWDVLQCPVREVTSRAPVQPCSGKESCVGMGFGGFQALLGDLVVFRLPFPELQPCVCCTNTRKMLRLVIDGNLT